MKYATSAANTLRDNGYKLTKTRLAVLDVLAKALKPLSPYDIHNRLNAGVQVNTVTIYRILKLLRKLSLVHRTHTKEGFFRCNSTETGCHYLIVCKKCGKVEEFTINHCSVKPLIPESINFKHLEHISEISGICDDCIKAG